MMSFQHQSEEPALGRGTSITGTSSKSYWPGAKLGSWHLNTKNKELFHFSSLVTLWDHPAFPRSFLEMAARSHSPGPGYLPVEAIRLSLGL